MRDRHSAKENNDQKTRRCFQLAADPEALLERFMQRDVEAWARRLPLANVLVVILARTASLPRITLLTLSDSV